MTVVTVIFRGVSFFFIIYITIYILISYKNYKEQNTPHFLIVTTVTVTAVAIRQAKTTRQSYWHELRNHQKYRGHKGA
jgi:hypothetical protein